MSYDIHISKVNQHALALQPALALDGEWNIDDLKEQYKHSPYEIPNTTPQNLLHVLQQDGAIKSVRKTIIGEDTSRSASVWRWNEGPRQKLLQRAADMNTLPCGCRSHIPDMRDSPNGYGACKVCGEEHRKQIFEDAL